MICPRCTADLPTLVRPCPRCGLMFIDSRAPCPSCKIPIAQHRPQCPVPPRPIIPCPLCGGKRHRKTPGSTYECLWRQWENAEFDGTPVAHDNGAEEAFVRWRNAHSDLMAGSVHAERIIRNAQRA